MKDLGYTAFVVIDSWHIGDNSHFGDIVHNASTGKVFTTRMEAINYCFYCLKKTYSGVKPVSKKGLQDKYNNELSYYGREFHLICISLHED